MSGRRLPDKDITLKNGSRSTLYRHLEDGRWVRLQFSEGGDAPRGIEPVIVDWADDADSGQFAELASVLVRPDGYLGHVRPRSAAA